MPYRSPYLISFKCNMFDWFYSMFSSSPTSGVVYPPIPPPTKPLDLPYDSAHVLLHGKPDVAFYNDYWDYPLKGPNVPEIIYSEKMTHDPLFSSKHQFVNSQCIGKLHFSKSLHPERLGVDKIDNSLLLRSHGYVISSAPMPDHKPIDAREALPVNYRIGGAGPGGPEMSFQGPLSSSAYQKWGPHFLGKVLKDGSLCIEPSAMEERANVVYTINGDEETVRESIIQTS